jgi:hypothetical protein
VHEAFLGGIGVDGTFLLANEKAERSHPGIAKIARPLEKRQTPRAILSALRVNYWFGRLATRREAPRS